MAGYGISQHAAQAQRQATLIAQKYPDKYEAWFYFSTLNYQTFLSENILLEFPAEQRVKPGTMDSPKTIAEHSPSPFVRLEKSKSSNDTITPTKEYVALEGGVCFANAAKKTSLTMKISIN